MDPNIFLLIEFSFVRKAHIPIPFSTSIVIIAAPSASTHALEVAELLEMILLEVDQSTLLTSCLRVEKRWQSLIETSPARQKHLFFRADYQPSHKLLPREPVQTLLSLTGQYERNPLLRSRCLEE
jgi:hypothetical protein